MKSSIKTLLATLVVSLSLSLVGCGEPSLDDRLDSIKSHFRQHRVGNPDAWLEKQISNSEWTPVALFFGYGDDYEACQGLVEEYKKTYPSTDLRCVPAN